ncbi:hypothetical protein ACPW96_16540 [Micromonospora sp. DT81.3]|uniref:hypothetical protein n=1 Tax=Actinomycetes TaxID=1760 RepID=UPI003CF9875F
MTYTADKPALAPSSEELRARIPGWGADLDHADRPAYPQERTDLVSGAHWDFPERQPETNDRERSIEHKFLTPVYGTAQPLKGVSGVIRRLAYDRFSEGQTAHWLLLIVGDRVEAIGSHVVSFASLRPDNPITQTGVLSEIRRRPVSSRIGRGRVDMKHAWMDPIIVGGPWIAAGAALALGTTLVVRFARSLR